MERWLWNLVGDDAAVRRRAAERLMALWEADFDGFPASLRAAATAPGFDTAEFVGRLCERKLSIAGALREKCDREAARRDRTSERVRRSVARMSHDEGMARMTRVLRAELARDEATVELAEALAPVGLCTGMVFTALGEVLLRNPIALTAVLDFPPERFSANQALRAIGPPAVGFAPRLLALVDGAAANDRFELPAVLGSIGRGDPATVAAVLDRLGSPDSEVRNAAVATLGAMGPDLAGRNEDAIRGLLAACTEEPTRWWAVGALADVAPTDPRTADVVLAMMTPRPPVWEAHVQGGTTYEGDRAMFERGYAISAAARLTAFADRVVTALVEALDSFAEFDCDEGYYGEHARVCRALTAFGSAAAPAVPKLLTATDELPTEQLRLIAAIGPPAVSILPRLWHLRDDRETPLDPTSELDAAILAVGG